MYIVYFYKGYYCKRTIDVSSVEDCKNWLNKYFPHSILYLVRSVTDNSILYSNLVDVSLFELGE